MIGSTIVIVIKPLLVNEDRSIQNEHKSIMMFKILKDNLFSKIERIKNEQINREDIPPM
jgi:hypothetical protein